MRIFGNVAAKARGVPAAVAQSGSPRHNHVAPGRNTTRLEDFRQANGEHEQLDDANVVQQDHTYGGYPGQAQLTGQERLPNTWEGNYAPHLSQSQQHYKSQQHFNSKGFAFHNSSTPPAATSAATSPSLLFPPSYSYYHGGPTPTTAATPMPVPVPPPPPLFRTQVDSAQDRIHPQDRVHDHGASSSSTFSSHAQSFAAHHNSQAQSFAAHHNSQAQSFAAHHNPHQGQSFAAHHQNSVVRETAAPPCPTRSLRSEASQKNDCSTPAGGQTCSTTSGGSTRKNIAASTKSTALHDRNGSTTTLEQQLRGSLAPFYTAEIIDIDDPLARGRREEYFVEEATGAVVAKGSVMQRFRERRMYDAMTKSGILQPHQNIWCSACPRTMTFDWPGQNYQFSSLLANHALLFAKDLGFLATVTAKACGLDAFMAFRDRLRARLWNRPYPLYPLEHVPQVGRPASMQWEDDVAKDGLIQASSTTRTTASMPLNHWCPRFFFQLWYRAYFSSVGGGGSCPYHLLAREL